jgi:hypothetical protein
VSHEHVIEKQIYNILSDLGFKIKEKYSHKNRFFDFVLEYGNNKYLVEIKNGRFDMNRVKTQIQVYQGDINKEYTTILIFDHEKFSRQEIVSLSQEGVILIDTSKLIRIQRNLYYRNDVVKFYNNALKTEKTKKYINNIYYSISFANSKEELQRKYEAHKSVEKCKLFYLDQALVMHGDECDYGYIYFDKRLAYDSSNKKIIMSSSDNNSLIENAFILLTRANKGNMIFCEDLKLQTYLKNKIISNPIDVISTK